MAATDTTTGEGLLEPKEECERESSLEAAAAAFGPLRDPDGCVLACPDCTCRLLLEKRRSPGDPR